MIQLEFTRIIHDPGGGLEALLQRLQELHAGSARGVLALCLGSTRVSDVEGISAAGADAVARRLTPAIDAEALVLGRPVSAEKVPVSPKGIVSPVVLSRAMLQLLTGAVELEIFDCGSFRAPGVAHHSVGALVAENPESGAALPLNVVRELFEAGRREGRSLSAKYGYLLIGECVPGGTTTALGVLMGLGLDAQRLVSSSMPTADNGRRAELIRTGLRRAALGLGHAGHADAGHADAGHADVGPADVGPADAGPAGAGHAGAGHADAGHADAGHAGALLSHSLDRNRLQRALAIIAAVGDPMQAFACGMALEAAARVPVILGGGTQMLALYALAAVIAGGERLGRSPIAVASTKWVAFDKSANAVRLAELVGAPFVASCPNLRDSRHAGLQAYEDGNVKEGVAAGSLMVLANLFGRSDAQIVEAIDRQYDEMVLR